MIEGAGNGNLSKNVMSDLILRQKMLLLVYTDVKVIRYRWIKVECR